MLSADPVVTLPQDPDQSFAAKAARELAQLEAAVAKMRLVLAGLEKDVTNATERLGSTESAQLVEANEQLVLSALRARDEADTATRALESEGVTQSVQSDPLTGLPNRAVLHDRLERAIAASKRDRSALAVLFLDLNNFNDINDTLGRAVGDEVLKLVALRLAATVRETDTLSRLGSDGFVVLLTKITAASDAMLVAAKLSEALATPSRIGDYVLRLTASSGISLFPDDGEDPATLIERANAALHRAKREGLGSVVFHGIGTGSECHLNPPARTALRRPLTPFQLAATDHEEQRAVLVEANEQLIFATLSAKELQESAEKAQQRQAELLVMVAHELRNPLAPIRTAASAVSRLPMDLMQLRQLQAIIERQVAQMTRLVGDLLDISSAGVGKLRIERHPIEILAVIDAAIDICRPAMDARLQTLAVHVPIGPVPMRGDFVRLTQVFCNLLDNASKYTSEGGQIKLSLQRLESAVVVTVSDNGIGITDEVLRNVFDPFVQDPRALSFNGVGLGLGLTVVRELAGAHGGSVEARSAGSGLGSEFVVTLPLEPCL